MTSLFLKVFLIVTPVFLVILLAMIWYDMYRKNQIKQPESDLDERFDVEADAQPSSAMSEETQTTDVEQEPEQNQEGIIIDNLFTPVNVFDDSSFVENATDVEVEPGEETVQDSGEEENQDNSFIQRSQENAEHNDITESSDDDVIRFVDESNVDKIVLEEKGKIQSEMPDANNQDEPSPSEEPEAEEQTRSQQAPDFSVESYTRKAILNPQESIFNMCDNQVQSMLEKAENSEIETTVEERPAKPHRHKKKHKGTNVNQSPTPDNDRF